MIMPAGRTAAVTGKAAPLAKRPEGRNAEWRAPNWLHIGTKVNALFTIGAVERYASAMLLLAAAAALVSSTPEGWSPSAGASAQARVTIRIVAAVTLRLGEGPLSGDAPPAQDTVVHTDGDARAARLIEFQ